MFKFVSIFLSILSLGLAVLAKIIFHVDAPWSMFICVVALIPMYYRYENPDKCTLCSDHLKKYLLNTKVKYSNPMSLKSGFEYKHIILCENCKKYTSRDIDDEIT